MRTKASDKINNISSETANPKEKRKLVYNKSGCSMHVQGVPRNMFCGTPCIYVASFFYFCSKFSLFLLLHFSCNIASTKTNELN